MARNARAAIEANRKKDMAAAGLANWSADRLLEADAAKSLVASYGLEITVAADLINRERSKRGLKK